MKKLIALLSCTLAAAMLSGCGKTAKLKYDTIENVKEGVEEALSNSYDNITITDNITISIPDELNTYDPEGTVFIEGENDPKIKSTIELLYDYDDFDAAKNPDDDIIIAPINQESDDPSYQFFNYTKDELTAVSRSGYIHLSSNELLGDEVIESEYIDKMQNDKICQKALAAANEKMDKVVALQENYDMRPYLLRKLRSEEGNIFYEIYYCAALDGVSIIPFSLEVLDPFAENALPQRWFGDKLCIWVDDSFNVCGIHINSLWKADKKDSVKKIPTLDSVLDYISKEIAPNYTVEITNIQLMYGRDNGERSVCPIWYIEFKNESEDIGEYNRIVVNTVTGNIASSINGSYDEHQG